MGIAIAPEQIRSTSTRLFNGDGCPLEWLRTRQAEASGTQLKPKYFFEFGTAGHGMIETYINTGSEDAAWEWFVSWKETINWDREWFETKNGRVADFNENLETVFAKWKEQYETHYLADTKSKPRTEVYLSYTLPSGAIASGTIDAVFVNSDEHPYVVDWKLGSSKSGKDMQLYVYWYLLRKNGVVPESAFFRGHFHYVNYSNPIGYTATGRYPGDKFIEDYINHAEKNRRSGTYMPNPSWFSCAYCEYKDSCPLYTNNPSQEWEEIKEIKVIFV